MSWEILKAMVGLEVVKFLAALCVILLVSFLLLLVHKFSK